MGSIFKKTFIALVLISIGLVSFYLVIPYVKSLSRETLGKRIEIQLLSDAMEPIDIEVGTTTLTVDLALNDSAREMGLSMTRNLEEKRGMLFVFEEPGYPAIWMKGMSFPIDIIWIDKDFQVVDIEKNVSPNTYPRSFEPDTLSKYVLEVNAGFVDKYGIMIGDMVRAAEK